MFVLSADTDLVVKAKKGEHSKKTTKERITQRSVVCFIFSSSRFSSLSSEVKHSP
jgi:hypothetical protein